MKRHGRGFTSSDAPWYTPTASGSRGVVEVDEIYVGGEEAGAKGRYTKRKAIVAIAVELEGEYMAGFACNVFRMSRRRP